MQFLRRNLSGTRVLSSPSPLTNAVEFYIAQEFTCTLPNLCEAFVWCILTSGVVQQGYINMDPWGKKIGTLP